jgi:hypothetical protein
VEWVFVKDKGWTHQRDVKPGDQIRLKSGEWETVPPDQIIRATGEHPFYVEGKGWTPLCQIKPGDRVRTEDGWAAVKEVENTGVWETVYNLRVADFHTYFVGKPEWGFSVWAHNSYSGELKSADLALEAGRRKRLPADLATQTAARKAIVESVFAEGMGQGDTLLGKLGISLDRNLNHLAEATDAATGKSHIIYLLKDKATGEVAYVGRASEVGNPMQAFGERVRKGHDVYDPALHDVQIVEAAPTRSVVRGAEEVYLIGLRDQGVQLVNSEMAWGVGYDNAARAKKSLDYLQDYADYLRGGQRK